MFTILSLLERGVNCKQNPYNISHHTQSVLSHYPLKVKVLICDKLQTSCLIKTKYILLHGLADYAVVKFTTAAWNVHLLLAYTLEDAYATRQLHRQWRCGLWRAEHSANASSVRQSYAAAAEALAAEFHPISCSRLDRGQCYSVGSHRSGGMKPTVNY